jgi:Zn-dependent M28 family amino/carboxypeptidase
MLKLLCLVLSPASVFGLVVASLTANGTAFAQAPGAQTIAVPRAVSAAAASIDPEKLRAHVRFLSHDLLEGRGTGQRGGDIAAQYIATQFALDGLKPAGDNGTYLQRVNFVGIRTDPDGTTFGFSSATTGKRVTLSFPEDFVTTNQTATPIADIHAPIVFVGFGIHAAELNWDDYKGVDLHGKVALVFVSQPMVEASSPFHDKPLTYYGRWTYKFEELARRGAIGVLIIHRTDLASYGWQVIRTSNGLTEKSYLADDPLNTLQAASWISHESADKLLGLAGSTLDAAFQQAQSRDFHPQELNVTLDAHIVSKARRFSSNNVIAQLPGANVAAGKPDAAVFYTGHYDHLGVGTATTGDNIYNGAADNATGSAIVMEEARAWAQYARDCKCSPAHSIFFASVTAEEQGLLGSKYLGMHPPIKASQISLDLNYDELLPVGDAASANVSGAERTTFWPVVQATARQMHIELQQDDQPMAGHYYRSDHFSFARVGVPAFSVDMGTLFVGHDNAWGVEQKRVYDEQRYHQVTDEYDPGMDFSGNATLARFGFILGYRASELATPLGWQKGDEFEAARKGQ